MSYEPGLGPINFREIELPPEFNITRTVPGLIDCLTPDSEARYWTAPAGLDWVIVGGESGPGARSFDVSLARAVVEQCRNSNVAVFVKQFGAVPMEHPSRIREWPAESQRRFKCLDSTGPLVKMVLQDRKGGTMEEWPEDLRVREFPQ